MKRYCLAFLVFAGTPSASAQLVCSMSVTPIQFEPLTSTNAGTYDARGSVVVTCAGSQGAAIAACVQLAQGAVNAFGQRLLAPSKGAGALPMQLFQDATLTRPWGSGGAGQAQIMQRTGDGPMSATVYARLYVQRGGAAAGAYMASFPVTLRYGVVNGGIAACDAFGVAAPKAASGAMMPAPVSAKAGKR